MRFLILLLLCSCGRLGFANLADETEVDGAIDSSLPDAMVVLDAMVVPDARVVEPSPEAWLAFLHSHGQLLTETSLENWSGDAVLSGIDATTFPQGSLGVAVTGRLSFTDIPNLEDLYFLTGVTSLGRDSSISGPDLISLAGLEAVTSLGLGADISIGNVGSGRSINSEALANLVNVPWGAGLGITSSQDLSGTEVLSLENLGSPADTRCLDLGNLHFIGHSASKLNLSITNGFGNLIVAKGPLSEIDIRPGSSLCQLSLQDNQISSVASLSGLQGLLTLDLSGNPITDLTPLASLSSSLSSLFLARTQVSELAVLSALSSLARVDISDTLVTDLSPLLSLPALASLSLGGIAINQSRLDSLGSISLTQLEGDITWSGSGLTSLLPLAGITRMCTGGTIDLSDNELTSLAGLESVTLMGTTMDLRGNPDLSELTGLTNLQRMVGSTDPPFLLHLPENLTDIRGLSNLQGHLSWPNTLSFTGTATITNKAMASSVLCTAIDTGAVLLSGAIKSDVCLP